MSKKAKCAFDAGLKCNALTNKQCGKCAFFKTEKQLKKGRIKADERIRSLRYATQIMLRTKYHEKEIDDERFAYGYR